VDVARLSTSPIGRLIEIQGFDPRFNEDYRTSAYLPEPLPSHVALTSATHATIADAAAQVARADQAARQLPNPDLLVRPAIRQEAVSTSALEGTFAALTDVLEADFLDEDELSSSVAEVRNYVRTAEQALSWVDERPITVASLEHLQKMLVHGTRADTAEAGHVRTTQVFIGAENRRISEARFVPPPPGDLLRDGLQAWQKWINQKHDLHAVGQAALAHYQFEALHPFTDGNGRLGRLVVLLQLITAQELRAPIINLSPWLNDRRDEYQGRLFEVSASGDFSPWVTFFCHALSHHAREAVARVDKLIDLRERLLNEIRAARVRGVGQQLVGDLIGYPMVTARYVSELYGVSYQAANHAVGRLVDLKILRQRTRGRYARIFSCDAVLSLLEEP
jgi:Fic family protein